MTEYFTVYGPPGTGKTQFLHRKLSELVESGADKKRIGFMSFTRAAVNEALSRIGMKKSDIFCTMHSYAYRKLRIDKAQVVDGSKLQDFAKIVGYPISQYTDENALEYGDQLLQVHQYSKAKMISIDEAIDEMKATVDRNTAHMFSDSYRDWKNTYGYKDFTDMLEQVNEDGIAKIDADYLLIDEAQDLSPLQWSILSKLAPQVKQIYIVGDDDQAIYTWAGANPNGMDEWTQKNNGRSHVLSKSHRVPELIYLISQEIAHRINNRVEKEYSPIEGKKGNIEYHNMLDSVKIPDDGSVLILYRNHSHSYEIEEWLLRNYVTFEYVSGKKTPFSSKFAGGIRSWMKLGKGETITDAQWRQLKSCVYPAYKQAIIDREINHMLGKPWWNFINLDWQQQHIGYLKEVDLMAPPRVRMSTIHGSKGMEADTIILFNSMGERTLEYMDDNEHRVWYVAVTRAKNKLVIVEGDNPYQLR